MWQKVLFHKICVCLLFLNIQLVLLFQTPLQFSVIIWLCDTHGKWAGNMCVSLPGLAYKNFFILWDALFLFWVMGVTTPRWPWRPHIQDGGATICLDSCLTMWIRDTYPNLQGWWHFYFVEPLHVCVYFVIPAWPAWTITRTPRVLVAMRPLCVCFQM